jgi:hypothetical protein
LGFLVEQVEVRAGAARDHLGAEGPGALVTADALHVQKETARYLVEDKGADYLFTAVKDNNQPSLFAALDALDWENTPVTHVMHDRGHGLHETRTLQVRPAPDGLFPHAAQAFLIERAIRDPHTGELRPAAAALGITSRTIQCGATPKSSRPPPATTGTSRRYTMSATSP